MKRLAFTIFLSISACMGDPTTGTTGEISTSSTSSATTSEGSEGSTTESVVPQGVDEPLASEPDLQLVCPDVWCADNVVCIACCDSPANGVPGSIVCVEKTINEYAPAGPGNLGGPCAQTGYGGQNYEVWCVSDSTGLMVSPGRGCMSCPSGSHKETNFGESNPPCTCGTEGMLCFSNSPDC